MKRALLVAAWMAVGATGCMSPNDASRLCSRSMMFGHPTMTVEEISVGQDARVRQVSEGARGGLGTGTTATVD